MIRNFYLRLSLTGLTYLVSSCALHYELPEPIINSISPPEGKEGTLLTIKGSTLDGDCVFSINGKQTPIVTRYSSTKVSVTIPVGALSGKITATNKSGSGLSVETFKVLQ